MLRRPPLKTYQKKHTAQTSFNFSQTPWESVRLNEKIFSTGAKNKPGTFRDDKDYRDLSLSYLETTFDRLAKDVKLPMPPPQNSQSFIDLSSDVSTHPMLSPKTNMRSVNFEKGSAVTESNDKPKRRPVRPHLSYKDSDVVIKQRIKYDSLNLSTKKCKAVRTSKRKAFAKISKDTKSTTNPNNSKDLFATKPTKRNKVLKDHKQGNPDFVVKAKKRVKKLSTLSLSEEEGSHLRVSSNKTEIKSPENFEGNAVEEKLTGAQVANHNDSVSSNQADIFKSEVADNEQTKSLGIKRCIVKITINDMKNCIDQKRHQNPRNSLFALKCSTPINTYAKIDRSINRLSPITVSNGTKNNESSVVENVNSNDRDKAYPDEMQPGISLENIRKRISISYEEDKSTEMSTECCQDNIIDKTPRENLPNQIGGRCLATWQQMSSPTSRIQKSLEILKLSANVPNERNSNNDKSIMIYENSDKYEETNECTEKSKDAHSQLTPTGIMTTRSGRQLLLSTTKYLHDSYGSNNKSYPDSLKIDNEEDLTPDYEIIDNSQFESVVASNYQTTRQMDSKDISKDNTTNRVIEQNSTDICIVDRSATDQIRFETESRNKRNTSNTCNLSDPETKYDITSTREMTQSLIEPTRNMNILTISSHFDATSKDNSESTSSLEGNTDAGDPDWFTVSSNESSDCTEGQISKIDCPSASIDSCDIYNEREHGSFSETANLNSLSNIRKTLEDTSYVKNETMNGSVSKVDNQSSPESSKVPLNQRMNLLLDKVTIRKRRKTFIRPETELASEVFEEQTTAIQTSGDTKLLNHFYDESRSTLNSLTVDKMQDTNFVSEKSIDHNLVEKSSNMALKMNLQPVVLLERLREPVRCSVKEKENCRLEMTVIHEISDENSPTIITDSAPSKKSSSSECCKPQDVDRYAKCSEKSDFLTKRARTIGSRSTKTVTFAHDSDCSISKMDASELEIAGRQSLFLKPGKKWTRSLSILNYIQHGLNLEELSSGKGKNWRNSVQTILDMQQDGVFQSCVRENEGDKSTCFDAPNRTSIRNTTTPSRDEGISSASPGRFIPRISIRVVPDNKRLSQTGDTSFLEVYGITSSKSTRTLSRRSSFKPTRKTLVSHAQCEDVSVETVETEDIITAKNVVLQRCDQEDYIPFDSCFPPAYLARCRKIGEGVYGEVFLHSVGKQKSVIKIIPIEGNEIVNGERQKRFDEILSEIVIAKELHNLRNGVEYQTNGFVEVKKINCIRGKYPEKLIELWKAYDDDKGSDNDCPSLFGENQLYIALELGHGGQDLEAFVFQSAVESHALFIQTALALAVAEQSLEFEHRDLHWGNVLISRTKNSRATYKLDNKEYSYPTNGMQVAIIDFTLSRMSYEGCCIFNDLALDPALFTAQGEYQFEVYRLMRDKIGNDWQNFEPYTNVLWLHYTLDKMITALRYKRKTTKGHKEAISRLEQLKEIILSYRSAFDFVTNCENITSLQC